LCPKVTANEKGLAVLGNLMFPQYITKAKLLIKSLKFIQMQNSITNDGAAAESSTTAELNSSAPIMPNPMLAAGLTMSNIEKQVIWEDACNTILKDIANTFLSKSNQDKAGQQSDKDVFQAIGETIQNFPIPKFYAERLDFQTLDFTCKGRKYRVEAIAESYLKTGVFKPELVAYGNQILYEFEQDFIAMKWALYRMQEFLRCKEKYKRDFVAGDNDIEIGFRDLLKRLSEYNCPNMKKDEYKTKDNCPLKDECKCLQGVS